MTQLKDEACDSGFLKYLYVSLDFLNSANR